MAVHVIGNACIDTTFRAQRLPGPGETLNAEDSRDDLGGKGLNQAIAARRAGAEVRFWAAVGDDAAGEAIAQRLRAEDISADDLVRLPQTTDRSMIVVDLQGENLIVSDVACARRFDPAREAATGWNMGDIVVLQNNLRPEATASLAALGRSRSVRLVYNASPLKADESALPLGVDFLVVNRQEALALSGFESPAQSAADLRRRGAQAVVVTLGGEGALVCDERGLQAISGRKAAAVDTSGAGDVFNGVLAAGLDKGLDLIDAAEWSNRVAALATTRWGALAACPSADEMAAFLPQKRRS